ncbi:hypothetical protein D3C78_1654210 [compost metagenome]
MESSCKEAQAYHREVSRKMEADVVKDLIKAGMKFNTIEPKEHARMVQATAPVIEKYKAELGVDLVNKTLATIETARKAP